MELDLYTEARLNQARLYVHAIVDSSTARACRWIADSLYYARVSCGLDPVRPAFTSPLDRIVRDCDPVEAEARKALYLKYN